MKETNRDIWLQGVKTIIGFAKRSLLDYIDAFNVEETEKKHLGKIKGRIHNDLSQASFHIGALIRILQNGGDITPFESDILRRPERPERPGRTGRKDFKNNNRKVTNKPFKNFKVKPEGK